jgi:hypothetical protein
LHDQDPTPIGHNRLNSGQLLGVGNRGLPGQRTQQRRDLGADDRLVKLDGHPNS